MRIAVLVALSVLIGGSPAMAAIQIPSLSSIAADARSNRFPASPETAPAAISLAPDLATALRAEPLPGGQEKTLYFALDDGVLTLRRSIAGARYRASGVCPDCTFPQPVRGHTHPYENPFSVTDLTIAFREQKPSLMVTRSGQIWLALPTRGVPKTRPETNIALRYALFGNRLECPARMPSKGWASPSVMGRRVEVVARAAAAELGLALYVADPGQDFRRLEPLDAVGLPQQSNIDGTTDLNAYEMSLARLLHAAAVQKTGQPIRWVDPTEAYSLDAYFEARVVGDLGPLATAASDNWLSALPTTVYLTPFSDLSASELPFVSVQNSADCSRIMVLEGRQAFAPDAVVYSRGWSRNRTSTEPLEEGWTVMTTEDMPTGQVVPW